MNNILRLPLKHIVLSSNIITKFNILSDDVLDDDNHIVNSSGIHNAENKLSTEFESSLQAEVYDKYIDYLKNFEL